MSRGSEAPSAAFCQHIRIGTAMKPLPQLVYADVVISTVFVALVFFFDWLVRI